MYILLDNIHKIWYTINMENKYRKTKTTASFINYHFVFCPRYRRKIFDIPNVGARFKEIVKAICAELEIIAIECNRDHTHIFS